jgi:ABC-type sulfate transport system permease component
MSRLVGLVAVLVGIAGLGWLIGGANGFVPAAQQFEFRAGIPVTLLCALAATALVVGGGACLFAHRLRKRDGARPG